jgi:hypothetical protein
MAATVVWRDEMQGVARSQGLFSLTRDATRQFARQTPSHTGCGQIGCSRVCTAWCQSPSYDLRRTRRDLTDLTRNAAHGGINQRFVRVNFDGLCEFFKWLCKLYLKYYAFVHLLLAKLLAKE